MVKAWTWPVLGAALLLAIIVGINLGNAAVDGINPIHFQPPAEPRQRPIAIEVPPIGLSRRQPTYAELYGWEEGNRALAGECPGCAAGTGTYSASVPYFGSREELEGIRRAELRRIDRDYVGETEALERRARDADADVSVRAGSDEGKPEADPAPAIDPQPAIDPVSVQE